MQDRALRAPPSCSQELTILKSKDDEIILAHLPSKGAQEADFLFGVLDDFEVVLAEGCGPVLAPFLMLCFGKGSPARHVTADHFQQQVA